MEIFALCIIIFCCRIVDVSLGTIRTIVTVKGKTWIAAAIGFVEVLIWFLIVREALNTDETSLWVALAYAGGYASGTIIGSLIAKKLISTKLEIQVITSNRDTSFLLSLRQAGYAATIIEIYGAHDKQEKYMLYIDISSKRLKELQALILAKDPAAFITINEANKFINGYFQAK